MHSLLHLTMEKKNIVLIIVTELIFFSLLFTAPTLILSVNFYNYGSIDETSSYYYTSSNFSAYEELNLDIDAGDVNIRYVDVSNEFSVKIEAHFGISGANVQEKSYLDYFNLLWENKSSLLNFSLTYKSDLELIDVLPLLKNISVVVLIREDAIIDINSMISNGNFDIVVPFMVNINNVNVTVDRGNIIFMFMYCVIRGNVTGTVDIGNIDFKVYDIEYARNCVWSLTTRIGDLLVDIIQSKDIGANITGTGEVNIGELRVLYKDYNYNVGALFTFHQMYNYNADLLDGFQEPINEIDESKWWVSRYLFYSNDFPALNHYNITLNRPNTEDSTYIYNLSNVNTTI